MRTTNTPPVFDLSNYNFEKLIKYKRQRLTFNVKTFYNNGKFNKDLEFKNKNGKIRHQDKICEWTNDFLECKIHIFFIIIILMNYTKHVF